MKIEAILNEFLDHTQRSKNIDMGGSVAAVNDDQKNLLVNNLIRENQFNKSLIVVITAMFVVLFGVAIFFCFYYRNSPQTMGIIFGGSFLGIMGIMKALQGVWEKKCKMDMLLTIIPNISAEQVVVVIETLLNEKPATASVS